MRTYSSLMLLAALGALTGLAAPAMAQVDTSKWTCSTCPFEKNGVSGSVDVALGGTSGANAKYGEFSRLDRQGAHLVLAGEGRWRRDGSYARWSGSTDSGRLDLEYGQEGALTLKLGLAEVPHHVSNTAQTPFRDAGNGALVLPSGFPAASTSAMPLASTLQAVEIGTNRSRLDASATWATGSHWTHRVSLRHEVRDGTQGLSGSFFSSAAQLPVPIDQVTDVFEISTAYASKRLNASLAYQVSQFRNGLDAITWTNPFNPVVPGATRGMLATSPDNQFHQIVASGGYQVTPAIRANADLAVGRMTQDSAFLPLTTNSALGATLPRLFTGAFDGQVDTFNGSVRVTAQATERLRLHASYTRDVRENESSRLSYPLVATDMFASGATRLNVPYSFWQDRVKLGADWRGPAGLKLSAGLEEDDRERSYQETVTTRDASVWVRASVQVKPGWSVAAKLSHAERSNSSYGVATYIAPAENLLLRKFNLADRNRDAAGLRADLAVSENISLGLNADYANDEYSHSPIGLQSGRQVSLGADLSMAVSDETQLTAFAQGERIRSRQAGSQGLSVYSVADWSGRAEDRLEVFGFGVKHSAMKGKLNLSADFSRSRGNSDVWVDAGVNAPGFPTATSRLDSLKLQAVYKLQDKLSVTAAYAYEELRSADWRADGVMPNTIANLLTFGDQASHYRVNLIRLGMRYQF